MKDISQKIKVIFNEKNVGFAKANNQGMVASDGCEYVVVFLNNDTIVTRGWLSKLLRHLEDKTVGMVTLLQTLVVTRK